MGGTDDPSNLIQLTLEEHAEAHRELFEQFGKEEDRIAWLGLSGAIGNEEVIRLAQELGRKNIPAHTKFTSERMKGRTLSEEQKRKIGAWRLGRKFPNGYKKRKAY